MSQAIRPLGAALSCLTIWYCSSSAAQEAPVAGTDKLEEIVVTAQKRKENLQAIPLSVSVLNAGAIQARQIADFDDISRATPGVAFSSAGGEGLSNLSIRGVSSAAGSATVGLYLDDVSITTSNLFDGATQPRLSDLDRIEVLRGPQGTLYGASSMGGTIRFVTKRPDTGVFSADASTDISSTNHGGMNFENIAAVNVPLVNDMLAVRASAAMLNQSGYINNLGLNGFTNATGTNSQRDLTVQAAAVYLPNDTWKIEPRIFYQRDHVGDTDVFYPSLGLWLQQKEVQEWAQDTTFLPSLTVTKDLGFAELTSVTGYFYRNFKRNTDGTYFDSTAFATIFLDPIYPEHQAEADSIIATIPSPVTFNSTYRQVSQELRLSSPAGDQLKWTVGLYYADLNTKNYQYALMPGINSIFKSIYGVALEDSLVQTYYGAPGLTLFPDDNAGSQFYQIDERQYAAFGQAEYEFVPNWHATIGLRYLIARKSLNFQSYGFYVIGTTSPYNTLNHFYGLTPKFELSYDISPKSTVYASATKGFRLGGQNEPLPFGPTAVCASDFAAIGVTEKPVGYASDKLWSYEVGSKNRFLDDKLTINGAAYYIDWQKIQQQIYLPVCGFYYISNVGDAESYGADFDARYRVLAELTLALGASITHSTITKTNNPQTADVGQRVLNVPDWTLTLAADYVRPVFGDTSVVANVNYSFIGESHGSYQITNSNYFNPSYGTVNASVGMEGIAWDASLYAKNLLNDKTIIQRPQINSVIEGYTVRPLTIGIKARYHF